MSINTNEETIEEILTRSIDTIYPTKKDFYDFMKSGRQLRVYMGIDPTATYVHLGHATNYIILKRLQELGHKIVVLIGDFTAMIGDPSDKSAARKRLTKEEVVENLKSFKEQIGKILDFGNKENPVEIRFNSEWLAKLTFSDAVDLASNFTVQQMLERDNFSKRMKENKPLYVHEFFYPLMQGYDSVALDADVEIGGTDQTFNMLAGRTLLKAYKNKEKIVVTTTLLENPVTGEKLMSKSLGTGIALNEEPNNMYGKTMALPDEAIIQCFIDCTYLPMGEIKQMEEGLKGNNINPRDLKMRLAREIVGMYHSVEAAKSAEENFVQAFQKKEVPEDLPEIKAEKGEKLVDVLLRAEAVSSKADFRRLIEQKAIDEMGVGVVEGFDTTIEKTAVFKIGKKRFLKVII